MTTEQLESIDSFRSRAREFAQGNLVAKGEQPEHEMTMAQAKVIQAVIFDAGFAGVAVPSVYGGAGLTLEHQKVWAEEVKGYELPVPLFVSMGMLAITLLEHGTEELKLRHIPPTLRGDEVWLQLLSEPSGGSDMAAVMTKADRDGDLWVINGAKTWTTGAGEADYGMCLARTDWDAPKHKGLSMFAVPLKDPNVTVEPIIGHGGGPAEFFEEFLDDVLLPGGNLIGDENEGWSVAHTLLFHERNATAGIGHGLGLGGGHGDDDEGSGVDDLIRAATTTNSLGDGAARQLIGEAYVASVARKHLNERVNDGMRLGEFKGDWGSLLKLGLAVDTMRRAEIGVALAGADGVIWGDESGVGPAVGAAWLDARNISIAGGTNEMQRNIVSERLLGMPREPSSDRDVAFSEIARRQRK